MFSVAVDHEYTLTLGGFRIELEFRRTCENDLLFICVLLVYRAGLKSRFTMSCNRTCSDELAERTGVTAGVSISILDLS